MRGKCDLHPRPPPIFVMSEFYGRESFMTARSSPGCLKQSHMCSVEEAVTHHSHTYVVRQVSLLRRWRRPSLTIRAPVWPGRCLPFAGGTVHSSCTSGVRLDGPTCVVRVHFICYAGHLLQEHSAFIGISSFLSTKAWLSLSRFDAHNTH